MANVTVVPVSVFEPETAAVKPATGAAGAGDVLVFPAARCILGVVNSTGATALTIHGVEGPDLVINVVLSKTAFIPIKDTTFFRQSDGTIHVTTSAALVDAYAILL